MNVPTPTPLPRSQLHACRSQSSLESPLSPTRVARCPQYPLAHPARRQSPRGDFPTRRSDSHAHHPPRPARSPQPGMASPAHPQHLFYSPHPLLPLRSGVPRQPPCPSIWRRQSEARLANSTPPAPLSNS
eukprot:scaffold130988_cov30-Tisochrysis_lutea.AAC.2